jgi:hypothetical protein
MPRLSTAERHPDALAPTMGPTKGKFSGFHLLAPMPASLVWTQNNKPWRQREGECPAGTVFVSVAAQPDDLDRQHRVAPLISIPG